MRLIRNTSLAGRILRTLLLSELMLCLLLTDRFPPSTGAEPQTVLSCPAAQLPDRTEWFGVLDTRPEPAQPPAPPPTAAPTATPQPPAAVQPTSAPPPTTPVPVERLPSAAAGPPPTPIPPPPPQPPLVAASACPPGLLTLINDVRAANGLPPLREDPLLTTAAQLYSEFIAGHDLLSHTADGRTLDLRAEATGYTGWRALGENLAGGYETPQDAVDAWLASDAHRANILSPSYTETGFGCAVNPGSTYGFFWVEEFGAR